MTSLSFDDMINTLGPLLASEAQPTELVMHPTWYKLYQEDPDAFFERFPALRDTTPAPPRRVLDWLGAVLD